MATFIDYINSLREKENFTLQMVCEGICAPQEIHYLEEGKREADRLLEESILDRLGVGAEDGERYLDYEDYERWRHRHQILHHIIYENFSEAENLLQEYLRNYCGPEKGSEKKNRLEWQFYYSMLAQLRRCRGADREELYGLFDRTLKLTLPDYDQEGIFEKVLSFRELNLMLEAERYRKEGERPERYRSILKYIDGRKFDMRGRGKIYPKAVCYLVRCVMSRYPAADRPSPSVLDMLAILEGKKKTAEWTTAGLLYCCEKALNLLRENKKLYFLWEILCLRETLFQELEEEVTLRQENEMLARMLCLEPLRNENREWKEGLEKLYREFRVPAETFEYCYLYVVHGGRCISDVIRIRREMLGISQQDLCRGICDIKTLRRLERHERKIQKSIVRKLFQRLGLPEELNRTELISGSPEARELFERIKWNMNNHNWEEVKELYTRIKKLAPEEIKFNRQTYMRQEAAKMWQQDEIDLKEYLRRLEEALNLTMPLEAFFREGEKYLTKEEMSCIENKMFGMEKGSEELLTCMRRFEEIFSFYEENDLLETEMGMYDYIMTYVGSEWGSGGQYDTADHYNGIITECSLRCRRMSGLHDSLYDRWWNHQERMKKGIPVTRVLDTEEELKRCILLSDLEKMKNDTKFYRNKLNTIRIYSS